MYTRLFVQLITRKNCGVYKNGARNVRTENPLDFSVQLHVAIKNDKRYIEMQEKKRRKIVIPMK